MSDAFERVLKTVPMADRLLLLWVQTRCRSHKIEQPFSPDFVSNVQLLHSIWGDFAKCHPEAEDVAYIQTVIKPLRDILGTTDKQGKIETRRLQASRLAILNERYASRGGKQQQVDKKRIADGEPILLPLYFPFHSAPLSRIPKKKLAQLNLPSPEEPSPPFTVDDKQYRYVERHEFADRYGAVYRVPYDMVGDVTSNLCVIDMNRTGRDLPILLPYGFRFWAEGFGWDGLEASPGGKAPVEYNLPYGDDCLGWYQIDDDIGIWDRFGRHYSRFGVVRPDDCGVPADIETEIPHRRYEKGPIFKYEGIRYQYVDVADFIEAYHMPARVDTTDPWCRTCIPFFDAVKQAVEFFTKAKSIHNTLVELLTCCHLDDDVAVSLTNSRVPHVLQKTIDCLDGLGIDGGQIKEVFENWVHQQMPAWVEKYADSDKGAVDLGAVLFTKIYRILSKPLLLHAEMRQTASVANKRIKQTLTIQSKESSSPRHHCQQHLHAISPRNIVLNL